jgi:hypothetical protein
VKWREQWRGIYVVEDRRNGSMSRVGPSRVEWKVRKVCVVK